MSGVRSYKSQAKKVMQMPPSKYEKLINSILDIVISDFDISSDVAAKIRNTFTDELPDYEKEIPVALIKIRDGMARAKTRDPHHLTESLVNVYRGVADIIPDSKISKRDKGIGIGYLRAELTRQKYAHLLLPTFNKIKAILNTELPKPSKKAVRIPVPTPAYPPY